MRGGNYGLVAAIAVALLVFRPACFAAGDAMRGEKVYESCSDCHSIDDNEVGPKHRNVIGRRAGTVENFDYSSALRQSGIVWDEKLLDKWLTNPQALVPGARMFFSLKNAQDRADVIEYLKTMSNSKQ